MHLFVDKQKAKPFFEWMYWRLKKLWEKQLSNSHYHFFYTKFFGLETDFYCNKKILDIGCGPRGSLEWAHMATFRAGIDPLAEKYLRLGAASHKMQYINGCSENMPFPDRHFDLVSSFNSLDHVNDIDATVAEIKRVLKEKGLFLLIVGLHHRPNLCEPHSLDCRVAEKFTPELKLLGAKHYMGGRMYKSLRKNKLYPSDNKNADKGVLAAKFIKDSW